jgi:circadian clock protein KaiC
MPHSNQTVEYRLTRRGFEILDTYLGPSGVVTGSARLAREAEDRAAALSREETVARQRALRETRRRAFARRLETLREEFAAEDGELEQAIKEGTLRGETAAADKRRMATSRHAFAARDGKDRR